MIKAGVWTIRSETHTLNSIGIRRNYLSGWSQSLYLFIKIVIKQTAVIIKARNSYQLHAKFYQTTFSRLAPYTPEIIGEHQLALLCKRSTRLLIKYSVFVKYSKTNTNTVSKSLSYSKDSKKPMIRLEGTYFFLTLPSTVCVEGHCCTWTHSMTHTLSRTPLDEWSARRRDLYPATHNTHKRQTSMPPAGFEPEIPANERP
jgi:hypothetical protein